MVPIPIVCVAGQFSDSYEEESRPKACVGICYYNKLMALEAKEDLASHNLVYKDQVGERGQTRLVHFNSDIHHLADNSNLKAPWEGIFLPLAVVFMA